MKLIQVYLPTLLSENIVYNGYAQPILRYYERLVAVHLSPIIYRDLARTTWQKFKSSVHKLLKDMVRDDFRKVLTATAVTVLWLLFKRTGKDVFRMIADMMTGGKFRFKESYSMLDESLLLESKFDDEVLQVKFNEKDKFSIQYIALPVSVKDFQKLFILSKSPEPYVDAFKTKLFNSLSKVEIDDDFDVSIVVASNTCIVCTIDELDEVKQYSTEDGSYNLIVIDPVNETVYSKIHVGDKEFKYSAPLSTVITTKPQGETSLSQLASLLKGVKIGSQI